MKEQRHLTGVLWFLILTLPIHVAEEFWAGEGFLKWNARTSGANFSVQKFFILLALAFALVILGALLVRRYPRMRWIISALATISLINGISHLISTISHYRYSPGLISGVLLWIPGCAWILLRESRSTTRKTYYGGAITGLAIHTVITLISSGIINF
ncbi:MAG TPA: HXXEE domain-containing protein [Acidobacteriota bacterium]|nr:HXXEE domain-containing protein [Acidobacteriota bacterium]